jgi:hypothetical protein
VRPGTNATQKNGFAGISAQRDGPGLGHDA